jgi:hypothetical protein
LKRPNYNAAKRARELKQKAKRDAKLAKRQSRGGSPEPQPDGVAVPSPDPNLEPAAPLEEHNPGPLNHPGT